MEVDKKRRFKRHKVILITLIVLFVLVLTASFYISFFYLEYDNGLTSDTLGNHSVRQTFYLFRNQIYSPVTVQSDGTVNVEDIPYYYGQVSDQISTVKFDENPLRNIYKGNYIGQAEADFLYDTKTAMNVVIFYEIKNQEGVVPDLLWADRLGELPCVVAKITEPYSKKMLSTDSLQQYAEDLRILLDVNYDSVFGVLQPFGKSKYQDLVSSQRWYQVKRNWAFFIRDVKELFVGVNRFEE